MCPCKRAGVVIGYMSIVAESLELAFCLLGLLGPTDVDSFGEVAGSLIPAGLAVVGERRSDAQSS